MRWEDERYVRLYTRDTADWMALPWQARAVFYELLRKVDRAGILPVGKSGFRGVANIFHMPVDVVESGIAALVEDGCIQKSPDSVIIPNFLTAQESRQTDAARKRAQRERDIARATNEEKPNDSANGVSHEVTDTHAESHDVTPCLAVPSLAMLIPEETSVLNRDPSEPTGSGSHSSDPEGPLPRATNHDSATTTEPAPVPRNGQATLLSLEPLPPTREHPADAVFARYVAGWRKHVGGKRAPILNDDRKKMVVRRLRDGLTIDDLLAAVEGVWRSQWHRDNQQTGFDLVVRSVANVEKFRDMPATSAPTNGYRSPGPGPVNAMQNTGLASGIKLATPETGL